MRKLKENNKKTHLSFKNNINTKLKLLRIHSGNNIKWICKFQEYAKLYNNTLNYFKYILQHNLNISISKINHKTNHKN